MQNRLLRTPTTTPQRYLQKRDEVIEPQTKSGKHEWIIARSLCFYRLFDLTTIPAARRSDALQLKIRQWSPLANEAQYIVWQGSMAQVWIWDADLQKQQSGKLKSTKNMPESVLYAPLEEGVQFVQCIEGFEVRYWQQHVLKQSRWWSQSPNLRQWSEFQRSCGLAINQDIPTPTDLPLTVKPWGYHRNSLNTLALQQEKLWLFLGVALFIVMLAWYSVKIFKWQQAINHVEQKIETLNAEATPILTAKTQAMQSKQAAEKLVELNRYPHQLDLMGKIVKNLPSKTVHFVAWRYEMGKLNFTVEGDALDPRQYVKSYEKIEWFEQVKTENTRKNNQLTLSMQLKPTTSYTTAQPIKPTKSVKKDSNPAQIMTEKVDIEKLNGPGGFDWDNIPLPDFDKLRK